MDSLQKSEKEISVIIPCYNVEAYIDECVVSLVNQTFGIDRMELIFVNDASTDHTYEKLLAWEQRYKDSVKVISLPVNSKQGAARNIGMQHAMGKYIGFVDSDDYVEPDMYQKMYDFYLNEQVDCVICARYEEHSDGKCKISGPTEDGVIELANQRYRSAVMGLKAPAGIVQRLFNREWLNSLEVCFPEKVSYEDNFFLGIVNYYVERAGLIKTPLYHYRINNESTVQKKNSLHHLDRLKIELMKLEELINRGIYEIYSENVEFEFLHMYFVNTIVILLNKFEEIPNGIILEMQRTVNELFPDWKENPLLQRNGNIYNVCRILDYPFQKGNREEVLIALQCATSP